MATAGKRKRPANESFRKNFRELRDTGVPDTGPKRPKDRRLIALTPATVTSSAVSTLVAVQDEASGGGKRRQSRGGGRRRSKVTRGGRRSLGERTPRTQLRADIRNLINSAVDRGDVTPAPPKTVLTPHVPTPQSDDLPQTNTATTEMHSLSTTVTVAEVKGRDEVQSSTATLTPALQSLAVVEETPNKHSRVLRSALKGVHSLSSLQKRSLNVSQTPHSVTFTDHVTVTEYSPEKHGHSSDFTLDSSSSSSASPPTPPSHTTTSSADILSMTEPAVSQLEPLEEDNMEEEEGEEAGEEEEEEEEGEVRMQTPHLTQRSPKSTPKQSTIKSSSSRKPQRAKSIRTRHPKTSAMDDVRTGPPKTLSRTLIKNLFMLSGKRRMTTDAAGLIVKFSEVYLKRCGQDLATYASHAGRKTVEVDDAILLMKRQRFISDSETFEYLVNTHLPLEYVEELLPCAVAGKKIVPSRVK